MILKRSRGLRRVLETHIVAFVLLAVPLLGWVRQGDVLITAQQELVTVLCLTLDDFSHAKLCKDEW